MTFSQVYMLTMMQVTNHYLKNYRRSCGDTISTIKRDGRTQGTRTDVVTDGQTDIRMMKRKTICFPPLHGGGNKIEETCEMNQVV